MSERKYWFRVLPEGERPTMRGIATEVAERHGVSLDELRSPARPRRLARPRLEAYALIYATGHFSMPQIARFFRRLDHTTVLKGIRSHYARAEAA